MLIALGFLSAAFIGLLIVPAYRRRTERLAAEKIKRSMPLTETEIRADKDQLRAEYALAIHELEYKLEKATLATARQRVEINRRDAAISALEGEVERLRTALEGHENARRVLEQTITDRLPKVEQRLAEARKLLMQRDREVAELTRRTQQQARSLEDASQLNAQSRDEVHRLSAALKVRSSRNLAGMRGHEDDAALLMELETLRAKTRDQAQRIVRLEGLLARPENLDGGATPGDARADEIARLRSSLAEAEAALRSAQSLVEAGRRGRSELEAEVRALKAKIEDQAAEIGRLKAGLAVYQEAEKENKSLAQSKLAMHSRIATLEAQTADQEQKIRALKAEVAAANERTARQAAHYAEEMRRLGARTVANAGGEPSLGSASSGSDPKRRYSLIDRISSLSSGQERVLNSRGGDGAHQGEAGSRPSGEDLSREAGTLKAPTGGTAEHAERQDEVSDFESNGISVTQPAADRNGAAEPGGEATQNMAAKDESVRPRGGLIERITRLDRTE